MWSVFALPATQLNDGLFLADIVIRDLKIDVLKGGLTFEVSWRSSLQKRSSWPAKRRRELLSETTFSLTRYFLSTGLARHPTQQFLGCPSRKSRKIREFSKTHQNISLADWTTSSVLCAKFYYFVQKCLVLCVSVHSNSVRPNLSLD